MQVSWCGAGEAGVSGREWALAVCSVLRCHPDRLGDGCLQAGRVGLPGADILLWDGSCVVHIDEAVRQKSVISIQRVLDFAATRK